MDIAQAIAVAITAVAITAAVATAAATAMDPAAVAQMATALTNRPTSISTAVCARNLTLHTATAITTRVLPIILQTLPIIISEPNRMEAMVLVTAAAAAAATMATNLGHLQPLPGPTRRGLHSKSG